MRDLSNEVTVFVVSCGNNPNFNDCVDALENQTAKIKIDIIKDYYPMSVAFQEMLNRCKTKYYIECDEDMILDNDAVEIMYEDIKKSEAHISMIAYRLLDVHLDFNLYGVKIYKNEILQRYPYNLECLSCEVEQMDRMKKDRFHCFTDERIVGKHSPKWNSADIFERYYNLMEKFKMFRYIWMEDLPIRLFNVLKKDISENNLYALLGAYTSLIKKDIDEEEKDYNNNRKREFGLMESYFKPPTTATLYMTTQCNYECGWCRRNVGDIEDAPDMDIATAKTLLYKFPSIESICICGYGEPFMSPNLKYIIEFLKNENKFVGLITNGSLLLDRLPLLIKYPDYISISINGISAEMHEATTKTKSFDKVLQGIKLCVSKGIETYVSYVCTKESIKKVPQLLELVKSLGVKTLHLQNLLPHFKEENDQDFWDLVLQTKDISTIENLKKLPGAEIIKAYPIPIEQGVTRRNCKFPWSTIQVNGNGSISICNSIYPCRSENGNINDHVVWQNAYCQDFRSSILSEQKTACTKCFRNWQI